MPISKTKLTHTISSLLSLLGLSLSSIQNGEQLELMPLDEQINRYFHKEYEVVFLPPESVPHSSDSYKSDHIQWLMRAQRPGRLRRRGLFLVLHILCERFNHYGVRTLLILYLREKLHFEEDTAVALFHLFSGLLYLSAVAGTILERNIWGGFNTLFKIMFVYLVGSLLLTASTMVEPYLQRFFALIGLFIINICIGIIKPSLMSTIPEQYRTHEWRDCAKMFRVSAKVTGVAAVTATLFMPIIRADFECGNQDDCYSVAFALCTIVFCFSLLFFAFGLAYYRKINPKDNHCIVYVADLIMKALRTKIDHMKQKINLGHWIDCAHIHYEKQFVADVKKFHNFCIMLLPLSIFWALIDQQTSRWVCQAARMDGEFNGMTIKPEQIIAFKMIISLILEPIYNVVIAPTLASMEKSKLSNVIWAGIFAATAFLSAAVVEFKLNQPKTHTFLKENTAAIRLYNGMPCRYRFQLADIQNESEPTSFVEPMHVWTQIWQDIERAKYHNFMGVSETKNCENIMTRVRLYPGQLNSYFITNNRLLQFHETRNMPDSTAINQKSHIRLLMSLPTPASAQDQPRMILRNIYNGVKTKLKQRTIGNILRVPYGMQRLEINGKHLQQFLTQPSSSITYTLIVTGNSATGYRTALFQHNDYEAPAMFLQIVQIFLMGIAELVFTHSCYKFLTENTPIKLAELIQVWWFVNLGVGNLLIVIGAIIIDFRTQVREYLFYAAMMLVDMFIFNMLLKRYLLVQIDVELRREKLAGEELNAKLRDDNVWASEQEIEELEIHKEQLREEEIERTKLKKKRRETRRELEEQS